MEDSYKSNNLYQEINKKQNSSKSNSLQQFRIRCGSEKKGILVGEIQERNKKVNKLVIIQMSLSFWYILVFLFITRGSITIASFVSGTSALVELKALFIALFLQQVISLM